jgi:isoleucyl-tRNA synthetase
VDQYSADALRFLFLSSPLLNGEDFILQDKDVSDVYRKLTMIWNMYDFFTLYAAVDGWDSGLTAGELPEDPMPSLSNILDKWIVSRVHELGCQVDGSMEAYDIPNATKPILKFLDDASNWYVRRSRKRFWKTDNDEDKDNAYKTLHYVLVQLSLICAPFTPFLAEELYINLTGGESVHLLDWPLPGQISEIIIKNMDRVREVINEGLRQRAAEGIKLRQPLSKVTITSGLPEDPELTSIIADELNVKAVDYTEKEGPTVVVIDTKITEDLRLEGLMREVIRNIQQARKDAGLEVDDRIELSLNTNSNDLKKVISDKELKEAIAAETLAKKLLVGSERATGAYLTVVKIDGQELEIAISKVQK